jgi:hypothetical protein
MGSAWSFWAASALGAEHPASAVVIKSAAAAAATMTS